MLQVLHQEVIVPVATILPLKVQAKVNKSVALTAEPNHRPPDKESATIVNTEKHKKWVTTNLPLMTEMHIKLKL